MKLLFVHGSERIKTDLAGRMYTDGSYTPEVWDRYCTVAESVRAVFRRDEQVYDPAVAQARFQPFDADRVNFIEIPDLMSSTAAYFAPSLRYRRRQIIEAQVAWCDRLIVRLPNPEGYVALGLAKRYQRPYLLEIVGCPWDSLWNHSWRGRILAPVAHLQLRSAARRSNHTIYVTNSFLQRRYPSKGSAIGCSDVAIPPVDDAVLERRLSRVDAWTGGATTVLCTVGAIDVAYKGQSLVIEAMAMLKEHGRHLEYRLIGDGDATGLKDLATRIGVGDQVRFIGPLEHNAVLQALEDVDIYIQPSLQEGLPRALVEAMSQACPAIGSTAGGIPELLAAEWVFNKGDVRGLAELIDSFDAPHLKQQAARNHQESRSFDQALLAMKRNKFIAGFMRGAET